MGAAVPADNDAGSPYLRHMAWVGDRRAITASEDIYSTTGVKLLAAGYPVNSGLLERLLQYKLVKPIDQSCVVENAINSTSLVARARGLLEAHPSLAAITRRKGAGDFLDTCFARTNLPNAIRNKLTVLAEQSPQLLDHCLWCTMGAVFLGQEIGMDMTELHSLASAALLHDIGQMHIDHRILDPRERLDEALRRQVHSHPLISCSIVQALDGYDQAVARAILEHHERADGSGYPRGLSGEAMSRAGRVLSFVEFGLGILQSAGARHLSIVIKTYAHQFDPVITRAFWNHFDLSELAADGYPFDTRDIPALYARLIGILESWETVRQEVAAPSWTLAEREFVAIRRAFTSAGLEPALIEGLVAASELDSESHLEVCSVLREGLRQAREVTEILGSAASGDSLMQQDVAGLRWLEATAQALESGHRAG